MKPLPALVQVLLSFLFMLSTCTSAPSQVVGSIIDVPPTGGDPVEKACKYARDMPSNVAEERALQNADTAASIHNDGPFGMGDLGHFADILGWYCVASRQGSAIAAFSIGEILRDGYDVHRDQPNGESQRYRYAPDRSAAFYWYKLAAARGYSAALLRMAAAYTTGPEFNDPSEKQFDVGQIAADHPRAFATLQQAATQFGDTDADILLAKLYSHIGITQGWETQLSENKDLHLALHFIRDAQRGLSFGNLNCKHSLPDMLSLITINGSHPDASQVTQLTALLERGRTGKNNVIEIECALTLSYQTDDSQADDYSSYDFSIFDMKGHTYLRADNTIVQAAINTARGYLQLIRAITSPSTHL